MSNSNHRERQPGEIYSFVKPQPGAMHPFAIVGRFNDEYYLGCMITHGDPSVWEDNIPMEPKDFEEYYGDSIKSTVKYSEKRGQGSCFVKVAFLKEVDLAVVWSGQLTLEGQKKMYNAVEQISPEHWQQYKINSDLRMKKAKAKG